MPGIDVIAGIAIIVTFVIVSIATADAGGLEQRMRRRGSVGESAEAIRHAQDVMDYARGGYLGVVCTPSRRLRLSGDLESETSRAPQNDPLRPVQATTGAPIVVEPHPAPQARHLAARRATPGGRSARGIRVLVRRRRSLVARRRAGLIRAERRAPATTRPPADTR